MRPASGEATGLILGLEVVHEDAETDGFEDELGEVFEDPHERQREDDGGAVCEHEERYDERAGAEDFSDAEHVEEVQEAGVLEAVRGEREEAVEVLVVDDLEVDAEQQVHDEHRVDFLRDVQLFWVVPAQERLPVHVRTEDQYEVLGDTDEREAGEAVDVLGFGRVPVEREVVGQVVV